jgi:cellulose synthase/poly-beta-1,6-N-acetylglucosamine synthase-like glycosyltransferase
MQDIEFRSIAVAMQRSRSRWTKTVGMGGNGQFTRLSALADLDTGDAVVWRGSLIEDFELGLHLLIAGWETRFTTEAWIDQEALFSLKRYLVQRTRWSQGVMQCMGYLGRIWGSRNLTMPGIIELTYCLFQPWLSMLGLLLFPFLVISLSVLAVTDSAGLQHLLDHGGWTVLVVYAVAGMGPFLVWGILYRRRCAPERNFVVGLWWGVAYGAYVYASYVTAWRAAFRLVFRRSGWAKTRRNAEVMAAEPVEVAHVRALIDSYQGSLSETFDAGQGPQGLTIDWTPHNLESAV